MSDLIVRDTTTAVSNMLDTIRPMSVIKKEDQQFLVAHKEHFAQVFEKTHIWRTDTQKRSIVSDTYHPTLHSKFHQSILEQKVQLEQSFYLAKDFELKKLEIEELMLDLEDLADPETATARDNIKRRKLEVEIQFKKYELDQMVIAMNYRMSEVKGWQNIQDQLLEEMRASGMDEDTIWTKDAGEVEAMFFTTLTNLQGLAKTTDGAEATNLIALAKFYVQKVFEAGRLPELKAKCNAAQLDSLKFLGF
jgi:hypothetical protein